MQIKVVWLGRRYFGDFIRSRNVSRETVEMKEFLLCVLLALSVVAQFGKVSGLS